MISNGLLNLMALLLCINIPEKNAGKLTGFCLLLTRQVFPEKTFNVVNEKSEEKKDFTYTLSPRIIYNPSTTCSTPDVELNTRSWLSSRMRLIV